MQIAILGTGAVAPALGRALRAAGHDVTLGTRDPELTKAREQWAGVDVPLAAYQDLNAEVFINATNGAGSLPALQGWTDVFDLGDLTAARGLEMYLPLWLRLFSQIGRPEFNIKVVR